MALKVLSGLILPTSDSRQSGRATIDFHPHGVSGDTSQPGEDDIATMGPSGPFANEPQKVISLRQIRHEHQDNDSFTGGDGGTQVARWSLNDWFTTRGDTQGLVVEWETRGNTEIHEISYMLIEEAAEEQ